MQLALKLSRRCRRSWNIQPKSQGYLLKIQYFCNFSLVSLSIHPRSRRGAQRRRKGEGRRSCPPKTFTCFIRSSPADVKQNKQTLQPCRRQKQNKRSRVCHRKIPNISNYRLEMMPTLYIIQALQTLRYNQISGIPPRYAVFLQLLACFARHPSAFTSMWERTRQGEGRWSRPPKAALERSYLTENSSSANRVCRPRRKKTPDRIPETKEWFYVL